MKPSTILAAVISMVGFLTAAAPVQATPMFPLAPGCTQYGFAGKFAFRQDNGFRVSFTSTGPTAGGRAVAIGDSGYRMEGNVTGGISGRSVDFTIYFDNSNAVGHYLGTVGDDGTVRKGSTVNGADANSAYWNSTSGPLSCITPTAPAPTPASTSAPVPPPIPPAGPAAARLGVAVQGPTTLRAGQGAPYTVILSNPGDAGAPVELYVSFGGQLQQTGQVTPSGGVTCDVINNAGGSTAVHCTTQQLQQKTTASIVVQGRGLAPGAGTFGVTINSADPGAQFAQKSQKLNVSIT